MKVRARACLSHQETACSIVRNGGGLGQELERYLLTTGKNTQHGDSVVGLVLNGPPGATVGRVQYGSIGSDRPTNVVIDEVQAIEWHGLTCFELVPGSPAIGRPKDKGPRPTGQPDIIGDGIHGRKVELLANFVRKTGRVICPTLARVSRGDDQSAVADQNRVAGTTSRDATELAQPRGLRTQQGKSPVT